MVRINKGINWLIAERINEWIKERINEWMIDIVDILALSIHVWIFSLDWMNELMDRWTNEWERINE